MNRYPQNRKPANKRLETDLRARSLRSLAVFSQPLRQTHREHFDDWA